MSGRYTHIQEFVDFMGEDLRSSDILRPQGFSNGSKNCLHTPQGGVTQRPGSKFIQSGYGRFGITRFDTVDLTGVAKSEMIGFGSSSTEENAVPWRLVKGTFTLTNSHATQAATVSHLYDTATLDFRFTIVRNAVTLLSHDSGIGTEAVPVYLSALETAVDLVASFAMSTPTNASTTPAAYIELLDAKTVAASGGTLTVNYWYWERINAAPFIQAFETSDVSVANDTITLTYLSSQNKRYRNILRDGDIVQFFNTGGGMAAGLTEYTNYYVISSTIDTIKVSTTSGGTAVNITSQGTGNHWIKCTTSNIATLRNYALNMGQSSQRNVSSAVVNNVLYMPSGIGDIKTARVSKYDGQTFYGTGVPIGPKVILMGGLSTSSYQDAKGVSTRTARTFALEVYKTNYKQVDKVGNIFEGELSDAGATAPSGSVVAQLQWSRSLGFNDATMAGANIGYAIATTAATSLTFAVDDGNSGDHTLQVGDIAYFWDSRQSRFIQRKVDSRTASQIIVSSESMDTDSESPNYDDGQTPTHLDECAISNNLRVVIWRSADGTTSPVKVLAEIPWNPIYTSYYDDQPLPTLAAEYVAPAYSPDLLPACSDLTIFNQQLIMFGDSKNPNTYFFSDIENTEACPAVTHNFDIPVKTTAAKQSGDVLCLFGREDYVGALTGDLSSFAFRVDRVADKIGTFNQGGVQQIDESTLFFPTHKGPYVLSNGRDLLPLGAIKYPDGATVSRIEPFFTRLYNATEEQPCFDRCVATVVPKDNLYVLFVPFEDPAKPGFATSNSVTWAYDFGRGSWWPWYGINAAGGLAVFEDQLYLSSRSHDGLAGITNSNVTSRLAQQQRLKGKYNYADHDQYIDWVFPMHWEALGQPGFFKRYLRLRLSSHETRLAASTQIILKSYIDYDSTAIVDNNTLTWVSQKDLKPKVRGSVCRSRLFQLSSQRYFEPFPLSGLEIEASANFRQVMKE